ncbi:MAG: tryptophan synthase subunit alpha, partial [Desulfovibrionaceae bacterium]|nr:tryptophan synthase subunit alpha [Desulfovibrionaceae bacterium]
ACGVEGFIVPDLPYEEAGLMREELKKVDIALIPLVGLNTSLDRMRLYASEAQGYAYVVSVLGVTGGQNDLSKQVSETILRAKEAFKVPLALGFGLKEPGQLKSLGAAQPEAVVFGSALLQHLERGGKPKDFMAQWI